MNQVLRDTFKRGSKTYFTSSLFFPEKAREDVYKLYGFVRVADDFVDQVPPDKEGFENFIELYREAMREGSCGDIIVDSFVELSRRLEFDPAWTEAFLDSMNMDLHKSTYETVEEMLHYIHGSAEVIGLFMARIINLSVDAYPAAQMQGRAMQLINFIRDIQEDLYLGRRYLPLKDANPNLLQEENARSNPQEFHAFINKMLDYYFQWQGEAERGYVYIPNRFLIPIKTASDMYNWTARVIQRDPFVVYTRKVKPSKGKIILAVIYNSLTVGVRRKAPYVKVFNGTKAQNQKRA